jgi:hypothetical protein
VPARERGPENACPGRLPLHKAPARVWSQGTRPGHPPMHKTPDRVSDQDAFARSLLLDKTSARV